MSRDSIEDGLGWKYKPATIKKAIAHRTKNVIVARRKTDLAGFGIMSYGDNKANLDLLAVKCRYRRMGMGKSIVQWLETVATTAGIFNLYVQVRKSNTGAQKFYSSMGFEIIDEVPKYYRGQETCVFLYKDSSVGVITTLQCD